MISAGTTARDERLGELDREAGLAGRGRPGDDDERRRGAHAVDERASQRVRAGVVDADRRPRDRRARRHRSTWTSLLPRVRPVTTRSARPRLRGRRRRARASAAASRASTRTSTSRPSHASVALEADRLPGAPRSWFRRRRLTSGGHVVGEPRRGRARVAASRPPRRPGRSGPPRAARSVASNCASVSPQKPTMTSVEIVMPGHGLADPRQALEVVLDRVLAAHPAQDRVVARLDRQVEVLADATRSRPSPRSADPRGPTGAR